MPCASVAWAGSRCHNNSNMLRQQPQLLADILVRTTVQKQLCCSPSCGGWWWLCRLDTLFSCCIFYFFASAASFSTSDIWISGFAVVRWCLTLSFRERTASEDSCPTARVTFCRCVLQQRVCGTYFKIICIESEAKSPILS